MKTRFRYYSALHLTAIAILTGCVPNWFNYNYRDIKATITPNLQNCVRTPTKPPLLIQVDNINAQAAQWIKRGYVALGYSNFTYGFAIKSILLMELKHQAEKVGAEVAIYSITPGGSVQGLAAIPTYQPGLNITANTIGNASAIGPRGLYYGNYGQTTTITSPGTFGTQLVPTSSEMYNYSAVFLVLKKPEFLTPQQRALGQ